MQIVRLRQFVAIQYLVLQVAAIAIDMHATQILKTSPLNQGLRKFVHARGRHPDLCPRAGSENGVGGVSLGVG